LAAQPKPPCVTTSVTGSPAVRAAFSQLIDYAGLFPPAKLDMTPAVQEYLTARAGVFAWMLGRFIVPASRIPELLASLPADAEPVALSVIIDAGVDVGGWISSVQATLSDLAALGDRERRIRIEALEIALPPLATQRDTYDAPIGQFSAALRQAGFTGVPAFVELPYDERWNAELDAALSALSRYKLGGKLRCGGVTAEAFPSIETVCTYLWKAAGDYRLPFKATAGLHHPVRHFDAQTGAMMHGFLNVLGAAALARLGRDTQAGARVVACENAQAFAFDDTGMTCVGERVGLSELRSTRTQAFVAYGSCSFSEPTSDLQALGMLR